MRVAIVGLGLLLLSTAIVEAQPRCAPQVIAYDPYKPSDLAIVREYGGTVLAHAPLSTLLKLDPYVPSQLELLRQVGRGIPLWMTYPWHPYSPATFAPTPATPGCDPAPAAVLPSTQVAASGTVLTTFADMLTALDRARARAGAAAAATPGAAAPNSGLSIEYSGRRWGSAGVAVPYRDAEFVRVGLSERTPVYRRVGTEDDVIYVSTTPGMVAPFRAHP
jgi:hypothetical protein